MRDTDFSQADDVVLNPVVELDLLYFDLDASYFYDDILGVDILTVRDTTSVDFLNGTDTDKVLKEVALYFEFENSIPRNFQLKFDFLTQENELTYSISAVVTQGTVLFPRKTIFTKEIGEQQLEELKRSNKLVAIVTIPSSNQDLAGHLILKSKATYFLEIDL